MSTAAVKTVATDLSKILGIDGTEDIASYLLSIEDVNDAEEYMCDLLDPSISQHKNFINQMLKHWSVPQDVQVYRKTDDLVYVQGKDKGKSRKNKDKGKKLLSLDEAVASMRVNDGLPSSNGMFPGDPNAPTAPPPGYNQTPPGGTTTKDAPNKKKQKFVPLFSGEGQTRTAAKLPGRYPCECQASKHALINNCTSCGKVVCEQEGSGPCLFCGKLVCTKAELEILLRGSKKSEKLRQQLLGETDAENNQRDYLPSQSEQAKSGLDRARQHKDKLLEFDRTSVKRTQVLDDESDYFSTDSAWLSKEEKEALKKREDELRKLRHASRKDRKITLDFAGRQVVEANEKVDMYNVNDSVVQQVFYGKGKTDLSNDGPEFTQDDFATSITNPTIEQSPPEFIPANKTYAKKVAPPVVENKKQRGVRIQDRELLEMSDHGMCLSMHQPWASLLVKGIKIHEGRSWYSPHRGRLWIAATTKKPSEHEVRQLEDVYRALRPGDDLPFPKDYPVSCLLGCVDMVDCLNQEEYRKKFSDGESESEYVFICENPQELVVKFPIRGRHKIYKLEGQMHKAAKQSIRGS